MKIKHISGYGYVEAKNLYKGKNLLIVEVRGEHERGLMVDDKIDVFDWLVKRFDKTHKDWIEIKDMKIYDTYIDNPKCYCGEEEIVTYKIYFKDNNIFDN